MLGKVDCIPIALLFWRLLLEILLVEVRARFLFLLGFCEFVYDFTFTQNCNYT
jgi:hypothetical protein